MRAPNPVRLLAALLLPVLLTGCTIESPDGLPATRHTALATTLTVPISLPGIVAPSTAEPPGDVTGAPSGIPGPDQAPDPKRPDSVDCAKAKCVALTMDDGPTARTADVLDLLKRAHVPATFFVLGQQAEAHPGLIRRMVREGHVVASHSWDHPEFDHLGKRVIRRQLTKTAGVLKRISGQAPTLLRPPYGECNKNVFAVARSLGEAVVLWDVDPLDWKYRNASGVVRRVVKQTHRGSIILTHDTLSTTREAYARIIDRLRAKGYVFVTVPQLLGTPKPGRLYSKRH